MAIVPNFTPDVLRSGSVDTVLGHIDRPSFETVLARPVAPNFVADVPRASAFSTVLGQMVPVLHDRESDRVVEDRK